MKIPQWIKVKSPTSKQISKISNMIKLLKLNTVCQSAACPNISECWNKKHVTVMILGSICTRACKFCNIVTGTPKSIDINEPKTIALALKKLNMKHIVITSVDRDDLSDGGAKHFSECIKEIRQSSPHTTIEILTPDFRNKQNIIKILLQNKPDVFNHNIETVPSLYTSIRPGARYYHSLNLLHSIKITNPQIFTKSGIMLGLGETDNEIIQVMEDLREAKVDFITIGQYLQPSKQHAPIKRYVTPEKFNYLGQIAKTKGFLMVSSSPLTRSSYHADIDFKKLKQEFYEKE